MPDKKERPWWQQILEPLFPPLGLFPPFREGPLFPWQQQTQAAPAPPAQRGPRTLEFIATLTPEERAEAGLPPPTLGEKVAGRKRTEALLAEEARKAEEEAERRRTAPFPGQEGGRDIITRADGSTGFWSRDPITNIPKWNQLTRPTPVSTSAQQAGQDLARERFEFEQQQAGQISPSQQQQFGLQQQQQSAQQAQFQQQLQFQQEQALLGADLQRQQEQARLAANPMSWLQYAAFTGEQPVVQPWMIPLGFQGEQLQAGQPLPGFQREEGQEVTGTFTGLPQLRTPSAQLQARWGPTAQQQFLGFRQARTGATPQETQFRLGSQRAPTGSFRGFTGFR